MREILRIARRDLLDAWRDRIIPAFAAAILLLSLISLAAGWTRYWALAENQRAAQQEARRQWLAQGEKNPHGAGHFGSFAFKRLPPLALLDRGLDEYLGQWIRLETHSQHEAAGRPARDATALMRFGELTPGFLLQWLGPLFVILLGFGAISREPISREAASLLTQMGSVAGLTGIGGGLSIDTIPSLTTAVTGDPRSDGGLAHATTWSPGLTVNWAATPNITVSGTVNPDFSQIEADVPQIEINQRFPLFYPEKRPFFLEGDQFFRSAGALNFLTTRQIVDPDWGAKLTARSGRNTIAVLAAADAAPGARAEPGQTGRGESAWFGVGRYQRDILRNSTIGTSLLYTFSPQPHTAIFIGYGDMLLNGIDPVTRAVATGFQRERRTAFVKLSHTLRK